MLNKIRVKIANLIAPDYIQALRSKQQSEVDRRVALVLSNIDILDYILKDFHGTFSNYYERLEDKLDARSRLGLLMWAYTQAKDPNLEYITSWITDTYANDMLRSAPVTTDSILYRRAQIAMVELFKREITRLSNEYELILNKQTDLDFDPHGTME